MSKSVKVIILVILLAILSYASYRAYDIFSAQKEAESSYDTLNQYIQTPTAPKEEVEEELTGINRQLEVDFEALIAENSDFYGWLYLPNDDIINYPVVQGEDNDYYLKHLFDGTYNIHGTLFVDYRNSQDPLNENTIIYGHRMQTPTMFHNLRNFKMQEYYEEHPIFYLELPDKEYKLEVFASYVTGSISDAYTITFNEEDGDIVDADGNIHVSYKLNEDVPTFEDWYEKVLNKSLIETDVEVKKGDKIITFSTCDYSFDNARFVVHCKVVETGAT